MALEIAESVNIFGEPLEVCGMQPLTGFFRDGCCNTNDQDTGNHTVCVQVNEVFLEYSRFRGNDLSTPIPQFDFPGLKPGDKWCLCAQRWLEAYNYNRAPKVYLKATHRRALEVIPLEILQKFSIEADS